MSREKLLAERGLPRTAFVGRHDELGLLLTHLAAAGRGEGHLVLVAGEPGIGKTRLVAELTERARCSGWQVLVGQADESEGMPPYLPFSGALRPYVQHAPLAALRAQLGDEASEVALLVREVRRRLPDVPPSSALRPEGERYRLLDSVSEFLLAIARAAGQGALAEDLPAGAAIPSSLSDEPPPGTGLLLCLDDLHWADTPSLLLLQHLARRLADAPLLVVGSYRPGDVARTHPLAAILLRLRREGLADRLLLAALTVDESAMLIAALTGRPVAPAVAATIHHETAGNPFFLEEVVRHLLAEVRDLGDPEALASTWSIPDGVRQMIAGRVARLSPTAQRLLQVGALLGEGFRFDALGQVLGAEVVQLLDAMDEVLTTGLLYEGGDVYHFGHALIRETLYTELSLARRQHLHLQAAETLERLYAPNPEAHVALLARHYRLPARLATAKALEYARRAADAAASVSAWEEAVAHREAALTLVGPTCTQTRCELLLALGEAQTYAGDNDAARASFQAAAEGARALAADVVTGALLARAALGVGLITGGSTPGMVDTLLVELLRDALDALPDADDGLRARLLAARARALYWSDDPAESVAAGRQAVAVARRSGQVTALIEALSACTFARWGPALPVEPLAHSAECLTLARQAGDRERLLEVYQWRVPELLRVAERETVDADVEAHARLAQALRIPSHLLRSTTFQVCLALLDGRFADAERLVEQGYTIGRDGQIWRTDLLRLAQVYAIREQQGHLAEAQAAVAAIVDGHPGLALQFGCALAYVQVEQGQRDAARQVLEDRAPNDFASLRRDQNWISAAGALAEVCVALGDRARAATLYALLRPYPELYANVRAGGIAVFGSVPYFLGLLAALLDRWDAAARHFDAALAVHTRLRARPWLARTQAAYAAMLIRRGQPEEQGLARELLAAALATARELGMARLAAQVEALPPDPMPQPGATATERQSIAYPDGLTAREVEVLRLLASGLTNKQIAASLVVSPNTVHQHLVNVYSKISVGRRTEATAYAIQHGLLLLDHSG